MKYFMLRQGDGYDRNPIVKNWYGKIDMHSLRRRGMDSEQRNMFYVSATDNTIYPDMIMDPVFMVSEAMRNVIAMYEKQAVYREVFFLDPVKGDGHIYYIPFLPVVDCIHKCSMRDRKKIRLDEIGKEKLQNYNIAEADIPDRQCVIVSLDFAESVLRKELTGIGLKEI